MYALIQRELYKHICMEKTEISYKYRVSINKYSYDSLCVLLPIQLNKRVTANSTLLGNIILLLVYIVC